MVGQLDPSARRQETPIIEVFEHEVDGADVRSRRLWFPVHPMNRVSPDGRHAIGSGRPANRL